MLTETQTLLDEVRAALLAAGYAESIYPDGPMPLPCPATFWPYGFLAGDEPGFHAVTVGLWDGLYTNQHTPTTTRAYRAQLTAYADILTQAGYSVTQEEEPDRLPWLVVTH